MRRAPLSSQGRDRAIRGASPILRVALVALVASCGGGGVYGSGGESGGGSSGGSGGGPTRYPSTPLIRSSMTASYAAEQSSVASSVQGCAQQWGVSGNAIVCAVDAKAMAVQSFLDTALANIQTIRATAAIDNQAIATMLLSYQQEDAVWPTAALSGTFSASEVQAAASRLDASINASYANASFQFTTVTNTAIQANMTANYALEQAAVGNAVQGCANQWGLSGNAALCEVDAKQGGVQSFLNSIMANLQSVSRTTALDKASIASMLAAYQAQDLAWLTANSFARSFPATVVAAVASGYDSSVTAAYSNALLQLNAL
jgi:hypothetical protein